MGFFQLVHRLSCLRACGISVSRPGIESMTPTLAGGFLIHWTSKEVLRGVFQFRHSGSPILGACRIFSCGMWDLVSRPGIEPRHPALGAQSLSHWTTREVLRPLLEEGLKEWLKITGTGAKLFPFLILKVEKRTCSLEKGLLPFQRNSAYLGVHKKGYTQLCFPALALRWGGNEGAG